MDSAPKPVKMTLLEPVREISFGSSSVAFGSEVRINIPITNILPERTLLSFQLSASASGPANPALIESDLIVNRIRLLYNRVTVEEQVGIELLMINTLFTDQDEYLAMLELSNGVDSVSAEAKNTANDRYFVNISHLLKRNIKRPLGSYPSRWQLEILVNPLSKSVKGSTSTLAVANLSEIKIHLSGKQFTQSQMVKMREVIKTTGISHTLLDATRVIRSLTAGATEYTLPMQSITGPVAGLIGVARVSASVSSSNPSTLNPTDWVILGDSKEDSYEFGKESLPSKFSGSQKSIAKSRYFDTSMHTKGGSERLDESGALHSYGFTLFGSAESVFQNAYVTGMRSTRGYRFTAEEQLTISLESALASDTTVDLFVFRYFDVLIRGGEVIKSTR